MNECILILRFEELILVKPVERVLLLRDDAAALLQELLVLCPIILIDLLT